MGSLRQWAWLAFAPALAWAQAGDYGPAESFDVPFDQLLDAPVFSVSRHLQPATEAPASVSVVTAADIRAFGHRTLADVLASVHGFAVTYDRLYQRAGVRGFAPPSDFNTRILVLIDGVRANDAVYDHGFVGQDFPVDIGLIDRVEIARGPGSSLYGGNAMLATINVITKHGVAADGLRLAVEAGSWRTAKGRLTWGRRLEGDGEALLSLTSYGSRGHDLWVADANTQPPLASTTDSERNRQVLARLSLGPWRAEWIHARRTKGMSTGVYDLTVDDPFNREYNRHDSLSLSHTALLSGGGEVVSRVYAAQYGYWEDTYATAYPGNPDYERVDGRWWGVEGRWRQPLGPAHVLTAGAEFQHAGHIRLRNYFTAPAASVLDAADRVGRLGLYVQDEWRAAPGWTFHGGVRYDKISDFSGRLSPRLAAVWQATPRSTWKLAYNAAFRTPNAFERLYQWCDPFIANGCDHAQVRNPDLRPEHVRAVEAIWQWQPVRLVRLHASAYANRLVDVIRSVPVRISSDEVASQFQNSGTTHLRGLEFGIARRTLAGGLWRGSLAFQGGRESDGRLPVNAPRRVLKLGAVWPVAGEWTLGTEMQALSARETMETGQLPRGRVGGHALVNLNLSWEPARYGLTVSFGIRNLFDRRYSDPAHDEYLPLRREMAQDGRSWRLAAEQRF